MSSLGPPRALYRALAESLTTGSFIDTKFYVFSRRRSSDGRVDQPRALYANGSILKKRSSYFAAMLTSGFSEAEVKDMAGGFPEDETPYVEDYDYDSDSDFGGEEGDDVADDTDGPDLIPKNETQAKTVAECSGAVVVIRDAAFLTFRAVLVFIHTGEVSFKSNNKDEPQQLDRGIQEPSAKSVYRLADKYGLDKLKSLAFIHIQKNISLRIAMTEAFSTFASWYPGLNKIYIDKLTRGYKDGGGTAEDTQNLMSMIDKFSCGELPRTSSCETLVALSNALVGITSVDSEVLPIPSTPLPPYWSTLKEAIGNAISSGRFIDGRVRTHSGRSFSNLQELYFSKTALGLHYIQLITSNQIHRKSLGSDAKESESDSDFDDEELPTPTKTEVLQGSRRTMFSDAATNRSWEKGNLAPAMTLPVGAYTTWKSALYYIYTGDLSFAHLKSQKTNSQTQVATDRSSAVPICSPKSMHVIAESLGLRELRALCADSIMSQVGPENIIDEIFSRFSSSNPDILEMQIRALFTHYEVRDVVGFWNQKIQNVSARPTPHYSSALQSIFAQILQMYRSRVLLRCIRNGNHSGTKEQWRKDKECPRCREKSARCESCGYAANFMGVFNDAVTCPQCRRFLKED